MRKRHVFGSNLELTELSFGAGPLGNLFRATSDRDAMDAVDEAWASGIRYFDTAPHYGLGLSELRLGAALRARARARETFLVSTKVGRLIVPNERPTPRDTENFDVPGNFKREWDFSRDGIRRSLDESLARLGFDYVDILYLHDPELVGDEAIDMGAETLMELRAEGMIKAAGIGSNDPHAIITAFRRTDIDLAMVAGRYTLLDNDYVGQILEAAGERSIVAAGVFNSGLLSTSRPVPGAHYKYTSAGSKIVAQANDLADLVERRGSTVPHAAIAFPLRDPHVASVVVGMRDAREVAADLALLDSAPTDLLWDDLRTEGIIRA